MSETKENIQAQGSESGQATQQPSGQSSPVPFEIAVLPLQQTTLFPETVVPLAVGRSRSVTAVETALATEEKLLACVTIRTENVTGADATPNDLYNVGTLV
ncbi:MAG TPA: LON peptidase substrate-binding domain-containing protein, partial [Pyrinomonadaceae bacterium]